MSTVLSVSKVYVNCNVTWSDYFSLMLECDLNLLTTILFNSPNILNQHIVWGKRGPEQVNCYSEDVIQLVKI